VQYISAAKSFKYLYQLVVHWYTILLVITYSSGTD